MDVEKFLPFCESCPNYNKSWSCPPLVFSQREFIENYKYADIFVLELTYDEEVIKGAITKEKVMEAIVKYMNPAKERFGELVVSSESSATNAVTLTCAPCSYCKECTKPMNKPCRFPEKMRYSLDAFHFDVTMILKDYFGIELTWASEGLSEKANLLCVMLNDEENEVSLNSVCPMC